MKKKLISKYVLSHEIELKVRTLVAICVCYEFLGLWKVWEKVQMTWKKGIWWCQFSMGNAGIANIASARRPTCVRDLGWILWGRWWCHKVFYNWWKTNLAFLEHFNFHRVHGSGFSMRCQDSRWWRWWPQSLH